MWHNFIKIADNWINICSPAEIGTFNKCVKFGLKIPNRLEKMSENLKGEFFDSHCIHNKLQAQHKTTQTQQQQFRTAFLDIHH